MKTVGINIKKRREELGLTQDDLAQRLGYKSRSTINKIEMGAHNLRLSKVKEMAEALETTTDYIMGWDAHEDEQYKQPHTSDDMMGSSEEYYFNPETAEIAQEIFDDTSLRALFHVARNASPEQLKSAKTFLEMLKNQENKDN